MRGGFRLSGRAVISLFMTLVVLARIGGETVVAGDHD